MTSPSIHVAILDDHQSIIDGYLYRLAQAPEIEVVFTAMFGDELEPLLAQHVVDVLILDVNVPTAQGNPNPYPILHLIPKLLERYPTLNILVISMHNQPSLIKAVIESGASGYILKDDRSTIQEIGPVVRSVAQGGIHYSREAHAQLSKKLSLEKMPTVRHLEVLSLCLAYPDEPTAEIAKRLGVANSTVRNLLSEAYLRLDVHSRTAAVAKAKQMGLLTPEI